MSHHGTKRYWVVFAALAGLTIVTVAVSYLHLPMTLAITLALLIATVKGGLVAAYFMHLVNEKTIIFGVLGVTVLCVAILASIPIFEAGSHVHVP